ncbi:hypothetical protein ACFYNZ_09860 [Streptomyces kebangsaanensis]|uniref:Glycosyltransferase RgtA/B/C/D-like domain-containing protein n=1 Tax=Streptomyces kebangsaanensis TaxID=864058 RepID=A0ABW6KSA5_9ACTN
MNTPAPSPQRAGAALSPTAKWPAGFWRQSVPLFAGLVMVAVVAAGAILRFWAPTPLWLDEAQSVAIARMPLHRLPEALRHDGSPPLYYVCLHLWTAALGTGDFAVRSLSGTFSVLALPLFWRWGLLLGGPRLGAVTLLLAAANPWLIRYASEARMYALVVLLVLLLALALRRLRERPGPLNALMTAAPGGLLLLTHYWALFLLAAIGTVATVRWVCRGRQAADAWTPAALALSLVALLPWAPVLLFQIRHTGTPWAAPPAWHSWTDLVGHWSAGDRPVHAPLPLLLWPPLLAGLCLRRDGTGRLTPAGRTRSPIDAVAAVTVLTLALAYAACRILGSAFVPRYSAVVVAPVVLIAASGTTLLPRRARLPSLGALLTAWLAVAALNLSVPRTQAGQIAMVVNRHAAAGDTVVFCPDQLGPPVTRLLHTPAGRLAYPTAQDPAVVDWVDYERRNKSASAGAFATRLLARTSGQARIWLVTHDGYRTYGHQCADLRHALADALGPPRVQVSPLPRIPESATLLEYRSRGLARTPTAG